MYWDAHIGDNIDSENPLGCHCPVAPAPSLPIGVEWTFFLNLWITYHSAIVITLYCLAIAATAFVEILLVAQWNTDRLARIREALAPCETLGQLRKSIIEMSILREHLR
ncbi:unnamed protein product [Thlaspi arvense]|uniref:Copper transporter n=1 Tax=Thlaspi arvense TaxID=13288 RepID=A0AAU9S8W2_THLAR|nr:unnamed protein product [Thlaspi arvense]